MPDIGVRMEDSGLWEHKVYTRAMVETTSNLCVRVDCCGESGGAVDGAPRRRTV